MDAPETLDAGDWLGHARALRRLAEGLTRDPGEVEDLLQETWLRSRGAPRSRPWLGTVLRNLARDRARARSRRGGTEREAAREEAVPSPDEIVARLDVAERLAREVAALTEPTRTVIHLRFFEELAPGAIATRIGTPLETVRTRLRRGLAELRARMDRAHGGERENWAPALLAFARGATPSAAASTGLAGATGKAAGAMAGKLGVTAAVLVLGTVGWFVWSRADGEVRRVEPPVLAQALVEEAAAAVAPAPGGEAETREVSVAEPAREANPSGTARTSETRTVEGRVVVEDESGSELLAESGVLTIGSGTTVEDAVIHEVPFEDGRWSLSIRPGDWIAVGRLVARGREVRLPEPSRIVPGNEPLVVRGRWLPRGRLRVVDALTGQDLAGIELRAARGWPANPEWTHPGDDERVQTVVADAASPIELPERRLLTPYWVHAPGHAWDRIDFDHSVGGERTVALSPEPCAVRVSWQGEPPEGGTLYVRLYPDDRRPPPPSWLARVSVHAREGEVVEISDLLPGHYVAALELGEYEDRRRLGASEVELFPRTTAGVTIRLDPSRPEASRTHLHGTLRVPPGLERGIASLHLKRLEGEEPALSLRLGDLDESEEDEDLLLWDAGERRTGTWLLSFMPLQHRLVVEATNAGGETEVAIEVPPLVTVRVEVVDAASGAPFVPERLSWFDGELPGVLENTSSAMDLRLPDGTFQFVAPRGPVQVSASSPGYEEASQELELDGTERTCRIEMVRATAIHVSLLEGRAAVPIDYAYASEIRLERDGRTLPVLRSRIARGTATLLLDRPGRYTLAFPPLTGFLPIERRTVEVISGETAEVEVPVERVP